MKNILHFDCDMDTHWSSNDTKHISFNIDSWLGTFTEDTTSILNVIKQPYVPQQGDKIYFLPEVSIPRVKFKNVSLEYGIKTVRDAKQANVFFGCSKSAHYMTSYKWAYELPTSEFKEFVELIDHRLDGHTRDKIDTALEFYENDTVAISWTIMNNIHGAMSKHSCSKYSQRVVTIDDNFKEEFEHLQSLTIYDESSVIDILNGEDATVIDKNMFEHLREMFNSSDTDNHVLAMEIMANSKYTESLIYLELLFHYHAGRIMDIHSKNHVNFKSLVSYLGKNMRTLYTDLDDIGHSLINKGQFTTDKLEIVMEYLSDEIKFRGDSRHFTVKTITVHPDYIAQLGSNYTYNVQDDYVGPELPIEFDEEERVAGSEDDVLNEFIGEIIDEIEPIFTEEEDKKIGEMISLLEEESNALPAPPDEIIIDLEIISNNNQITQTNESTDIDWF
jgi:hypothetical protein